MTIPAVDPLPLTGLRVLDLTLARAGPTCVRHLADWGADIIRVEPPGANEGFGGSRDGFDFVNLHRNKRSIALDLKDPGGHAAFLRLVKTADVLVENMRVLYERKTTGKGRFVHTSLLEAQVFMLDFQASRYLMDGEVAGQAGNDHPVNIPMGVFPTADKPINIAASSPKLFEVFCRAVGKPEWLEVPEWKTPAGR